MLFEGVRKYQCRNMFLVEIFPTFNKITQEWQFNTVCFIHCFKSFLFGRYEFPLFNPHFEIRDVPDMTNRDQMSQFYMKLVFQAIVFKCGSFSWVWKLKNA